jgi:capsular exopolysaccharide synthesis family protein
MWSAAHSRFAKAYRSLARWVEAHPQKATTLVVTGSVYGEGRTAVALNLAMAFAETSAKPTLFVDADMRRPWLESRLEAGPLVGFSDLLQGRASMKTALIHVPDTRLQLMTSGETPEDPAALVDSQTFIELLHELRRRFERIVLAAPPLQPHPDTDLMRSNSDAALMVVRAGRTPFAVHLSTLEASIPRGFLGTVRVDGTKGISVLGSIPGSRTLDDHRARDTAGRTRLRDEAGLP